MSTVKAILNRIEQQQPGELFFPSDFRLTGSEDAIKMALSRLVKARTIKRIAHGIYYVPQHNPLVGEILPPLDKIAQAIADRDHVKIKPTGAFALNKLGLSTQVPMRQVYITNGPPRLIKVGRSQIRFKPSSPRKLALQGPTSALVILALDELGPKAVSETMLNQIRGLLLKEDPDMLSADAKLAPAWINDLIYRLLKKEKSNDEMAKLNR
jgi:hypothetical protein